MSSQPAGRGFGLSRQEKADLERLIGTSLGTAPGESVLDARVQIEVLGKTAAQMAGMLLDLDRRLNLLYEVLCMTQQKSALLDERLEVLGGGPQAPEGE